MSRKGLQHCFRRVSALALAGVLAIESFTSYAVEPAKAAAAEKKAAEAKQLWELDNYREDYPDGAFSFDKESIEAKESDGSFTFHMLRYGGREKADTVTLKVLDVSARYGEDYTVSVKEGKKWVPLQAPKEQPKPLTDQMAEGSLSDAFQALLPEEDQDVAGKDADLEAAIEEASGESKETAVAKAAAASKKQKGTAETGSTEMTEEGTPHDGLQGAKELYTGEESDRQNWKELSEQDKETMRQTALYAQNQLIDLFDGASLEVDFDKDEFKKEIRVDIVNDDKGESDEGMLFLLGKAQVGTVSNLVNFNAKILDDDMETVTFSMAEDAVKADVKDGVATVTVERTSGLGYYASAFVKTRSGSAKSVSDYEMEDGLEVKFLAGQKTGKAQIPIYDQAEDGSAFYVALDPEEVNVGKVPETMVQIENTPDKAAKEAGGAAGTKKKIGNFPMIDLLLPNWTSYTTKEVAIPNPGDEKGQKWGIDLAGGSGSVREQSYDQKTNMDGAIYATMSFNWNAENKSGKEKHLKILVGNTKKYGEATHKGGDIDCSASMWLNEDDWNNGQLRFWGYCKKSAYNRLKDINIVYRFPKVTIGIGTAKKELTGKLYTASNTSDTSYDKAKLTHTVYQYTNASKQMVVSKGGDSVNLAPDVVDSNYVSIDGYDLYVNKNGNQGAYIGRVDSSTVSYESLKSLLCNGSVLTDLVTYDFQVLVTPVVKEKTREVTFQSGDKSRFGFSGDKTGGKGFKSDQKISIRCLDQVQVKVEDMTDGAYSLGSLTASGGDTSQSLYSSETTDEAKQEYTANIDMAVHGTSNVTIDCQYDKPDIDLRWDNNQTDLFEAYGSSSVVDLTSLTDDSFEGLSVGAALEPEDGKNKANLNFKDEYVLTSIHALENEHGDKLMTVWTYRDDKTQNDESVYGDTFIFRPWMTHTKITWFLTTVNALEAKYSMKGKVMVKEKPLFGSSYTTAKSDVPALGGSLAVGGEKVEIGSDGTYQINNAMYAGKSYQVVCAYDTLSSHVNIAGSGTTDKKDPVRTINFTLDANKDDDLEVGSTSILFDKIVENDKKQQEKVPNTKTDIVYLEDTDYHLSFTVASKEGLARGVVADHAIFRVYDKYGKEREGLRQIVPIKDNKGTLTINPTSVNLQNEDGSQKYAEETGLLGTKKALTESLAVGDSMTLQLVDQEGNKYFEHHTKITIAQKNKSMYLFNFNLGQKDSYGNYTALSTGSKFLDGFINGVTAAIDSYIDSKANLVGEHTDEQDVKHSMIGFGFGEAMKKPATAMEAMNQALDAIEKETNGELEPTEFDDLDITGEKDYSLKYQVGAMMDNTFYDQDDFPEMKGKWELGNIVFIGKLGFDFSKTWNWHPLAFMTITFKLNFTTQSTGDNADMTGLQWRFYNGDESSPVIASDDSTLMRLFYGYKDKNGNLRKLDNDGLIKILAHIDADVSGGIGISDKLSAGLGGKVELETANDKTKTSAISFGEHYRFDTRRTQWDYSGALQFKWDIYAKLLGIHFSLWSGTYGWDWNSRSTTANENDVEIKSLGDVMGGGDLLSEPLDANAEPLSRDYLEYAKDYAGKKGMDLKSLQSTGGTKEEPVKKGVYSDTNLCLQDIGNDKFLLLYIDDVPERDEYNRQALMYRVFDRTAQKWSEAKLIAPEEGRADDEPGMIQIKDGKFFVTWMRADRRLTEEMTSAQKMNSFNIKGAIFDADKMEFGDVMDITKTTEKDTWCDHSARPTYSEDADGNGYLRVYYTKTEFTKIDGEKEETIGDILQPYETIAMRKYDMEKGEWVSDYDEARLKKLEKIYRKFNPEATEEDVAEHVAAFSENWYGQDFTELAPAVRVNETIDEKTGYWTSQPSAEKYEAATDPMMTGLAATGAFGYSMYAYALDGDGNGETRDDSNLYLQIRDEKNDIDYDPCLVLGKQSDYHNLQLICVNGEQKEDQHIYLYWIDQGSVYRMDVLNNIRHALKSKTADDGKTYYYFDRTEPEDIDAEDVYQPEELVATNLTQKELYGLDGETVTEENEEGMDVSQTQEERAEITSYQVKTDGQYIYTIWDAVDAIPDENGKVSQTSQLMTVRETIGSDDICFPVQITDGEDIRYGRYDFLLTDKGNVFGTIMEFDTDEEGQQNDASNTLMSLGFAPVRSAEDVVSVENTKVSDAYAADSDGESAKVRASFTLRNNSVVKLEDALITVEDSDRTEVYNSDEAQEGEEKLKFYGGYTIDVDAPVTLDQDGGYQYTVKVKSGDKTFSEDIKGRVDTALSVSEPYITTLDRNRISVQGTLTNETNLDASEDVIIGYYSAGGEENIIQKLKLKDLIDTAKEEGQDLSGDALAPGRSLDYETEAEFDFDKAAIRTKNDDGSITDTITIFVRSEKEGAFGARSSFTLDATADEISAIEAVKEIEAAGTGTVGETGHISVKVDGAEMDVLNEDGSAQFAGLQTVWLPDDKGIVKINSGNYIEGIKEGTTELTGYLLPLDTEYIDADGSGRMDPVSKYATVPSSAMKKISASVTITAAEPAATEEAPAATEAAPAATAAAPDTSASATAAAVTAAPAAKKSTVKNGVTYQVDGKNATVSAAKNSVKEITIPATVKIGGKTYKVTKIANKAFAGNSKLTKVTIGKNITTIGNRAFYKCKKLKNVTIPKAVIKIGKEAFSGSVLLAKVTFKPEKVPAIGRNAFKGIAEKAAFIVPKKAEKKYKKKLNSKIGVTKKMKLKAK